jgi:hypothetical protein
VCEREGYGLKVESNRLVIFNRAVFDARPPTITLTRRGGVVESWSFTDDQVDTYRACQVRYKHPDKKLLTATYTPPNAPENGQVLQVREHVANEGEAMRLAKARLERANRARMTADLGLIGDIRLVAGVNVALSGWGVLDGTYAIDETRHSIGSGYKTNVKAVRVTV